MRERYEKDVYVMGERYEKDVYVMRERYEKDVYVMGDMKEVYVMRKKGKNVYVTGERLRMFM